MSLSNNSKKRDEKISSYKLIYAEDKSPKSILKEKIISTK